ncbi:hypothetical protein SUGI_0126280 [Cryptomeria japonica]|nr:hypothetical protein SUGI_0126280 [Cryptomeria japonica]
MILTQKILNAVALFATPVGALASALGGSPPTPPPRSSAFPAGSILDTAPTSQALFAIPPASMPSALGGCPPPSCVGAIVAVVCASALTVGGSCPCPPMDALPRIVAAMDARANGVAPLSRDAIGKKHEAVSHLGLIGGSPAKLPPYHVALKWCQEFGRTQFDWTLGTI